METKKKLKQEIIFSHAIMEMQRDEISALRNKNTYQNDIIEKWKALGKYEAVKARLGSQQKEFEYKMRFNVAESLTTSMEITLERAKQQALNQLIQSLIEKDYIVFKELDCTSFPENIKQMAVILEKPYNC